MYTLIHSNVDGAGTIGDFSTLEEAMKEAVLKQQRADANGNKWNHIYHVYDDRGREVFATTSNPMKG